VNNEVSIDESFLQTISKIDIAAAIGTTKIRRFISCSS
jgi:hypothetical protein